MNFRHRFSIPFEDADPAGIVFFSNYFNYAHRAIEAMAEELGFWDLWFKNPEVSVPIKLAEADYKAPLLPGNKYVAAVEVTSLGNSSVKFTTKILDDKDSECASITTLHIFLDQKSGSKINIPEKIKTNLQ